MKIKRREWIAAGGLAVGALGFSQTVGRMAGGVISPKDETLGACDGYSAQPEFTVDPATGAITLNPNQQVSYTVCMGCTTLCGVRVRTDKKTGKVIRVAGNPYNPHSVQPHLPMNASVQESFVSISGFKDKGLAGRSTACARGNAVMAQLTSPYRVLSPMKRVGPRNSGKWLPISFEQLITELVEGGDLFGEGHVDGFAALRDLQTPLDAQAPEFGPKVNQVGVMCSVNEGREAFARRFWNQSYGTQNFVGHGSYCGGSYRSGSGALFGNLKAMPHGKPDIAHSKFVMFIGTAPGHAGNPFKRTASLLAKARTHGALNYVVIDPILTHADNLATPDRSHWVPIKPGTDSALIMGMIRWMFENDRINAKYLAYPNQKAAAAAGEPSFTSASWLVITAPVHPRCGRYVRGSDIGMPVDQDKRYDEVADPYIVMNQQGELVAADALMAGAQLEPAWSTSEQGQDLGLKTACQLLQEAANRHTLDEYALFCGISKAIITGLAQEFTSHGRKASAIAHGGMMSGNGFYNAYGVVTLNALIGSLNWKGGFVMNAGGFKDASDGPRYNLATFEGQVKPRGMPLGRNVAYEKTSEFKRRQTQGNAYPARDAWFPNAPGLGSEWFPAMLRGYPYGLKALVLWMCNPLYGIAGARSLVEKELADPQKVPLIVAVDPFINETNAFADYIVPDSLMYESWGWVAPWNGVPTKTVAARWPVVAPQADKTPDGQPIGMESFFIALAKAMKLPGFGAEGLSDAQGNLLPLECAQDWYYRGGANIAYMGAQPVGDATPEDMQLTGVDQLSASLQQTLKADEWRKVAFLYTRGGRYQNADEAQDKEVQQWQAARFNKVLWLWNEEVGSSRNSLTGQPFWGTAQWQPPGFADGSAMRHHYPQEQWPLLLASFKSAMQSSYSIATHLTQLCPDNPMIMHPLDAASMGLSTGDRARIRTPGGSMEGTVIVHAGIMRGVVGIEHGYGHRELGARAHTIGQHQQPDKLALKAGVNLNDVGLTDPARQHQAVWVDAVSGACVRTGLPARVERV